MNMEKWVGRIHCEEMGKYNALKQIPDNSIDCIVTDPPYGYSFMGKDWDKAVPPVEAWKECLRVLKSGAFMFVMSAPRQDVLSQMIVRLGQAGFETGFTSIYWTYASGFPKALNISKAVDAKVKYGKSGSQYLSKIEKQRPIIGTVKRVISKNRLAKEGETEHGVKANMERWYKHETKEIPITDSLSKEAKQLSGSYAGFQPKPAVEVIIVAMKPLAEKTFVDQALANGKGVTWLDECRIPTEELIEQGRRGRKTDGGYHKKYGSLELPAIQGRFPANLLVSDDVLNDGKERKSQHIEKPCNTPNLKTEWGGTIQTNRGERGYDDSGSFSRYFDLDQWWAKTVENLPENVKKTFPFLVCPKASKSERDKGLEDWDEKEWVAWQTANGTSGKPSSLSEGRNTKRRNIHPTVKPIKLMSYLVTLGSRENDIILDPFVGSGTTCIAAKILNRKWIGIDCFSEYCQIASARLENCEIVKHEFTKTDELGFYEQYVKDMGEQKDLIETKPEVSMIHDLCPKCGSKTFKGKNSYYCTKIDCNWRTEQ